MRRSGLRMRMAVSYVLVTAAAVILVDGVVLGVLLPGMLASSSHAGQAATVAGQAGSDAKRLSAAASAIAGKAPAGTAGLRLLRLLAASPEATALGLVASGGSATGSGQFGMPWLRMHRAHCCITAMTWPVPLACKPAEGEPADCRLPEPPELHAAAPQAIQALIRVSAIARLIWASLVSG